jgi:hypothetical protein
MREEHNMKRALMGCVIGLMVGMVASNAASAPRIEGDVEAKVAETTRRVPQLGALLKEIRSPDDHDRATEQLGLAAKLLNLNFASKFQTPIGEALYIPIQISKREGGRQSLYFLMSGKEATTGVLIIGMDIYYRVVRRDSGKETPAQTGDRYTDSIYSLNGEVISQTPGTLHVLDPSRGIGKFLPDALSTNKEASKSPCGWYAWSFYAECG